MGWLGAGQTPGIPLPPNTSLSTKKKPPSKSELELKQEVDVLPYTCPKDQIAGAITVEIEFLKKGDVTKERFDTGELTAAFLDTFAGNIFSQTQIFFFGFKNDKHKLNLLAKVKGMRSVDPNLLKGWFCGGGVEGGCRGATD